MDGTELKKRRKERGLGQRELSKSSGVPQQVISAAENGCVRLPRGAARKLDEVLKD
jgi:predicted transcriptional regulator